MVKSGPVARRYHDLTVHSPDSVRASGHALDWDNKPFPFKVYTDIPGLHLTREIDVLATPALAAIAGEGTPTPSALALPALTSLLYYVGGVTKRKTSASASNRSCRGNVQTNASSVFAKGIPRPRGRPYSCAMKMCGFRFSMATTRRPLRSQKTRCGASSNNG